MSKLKKLITDFVDTDDFVRDKIRKNNMQGIFYFSLLAVPVNIFHIISFYTNLEEVGSAGYNWGIGIICSHVASMLFFTVTGIVFYFQRKKREIRRKLIDNYLYLIFFFMLMLGVIIVSIDQMVTPAITPFLIFCAVISLIILITPVISIPFFITSYFLFSYSIAIYQTNQEIILSNRVNGLTAVFLGIVLSLILWKSTTTRYKQSRIIEEQKRELEASLNELVSKSDELQKVNESKDKLFSIIAHDLSSPFNTITGFSELMAENISDFTTEEIERNIRQIHKTSVQTQNLLFELLTWAKLQTDNVIFVPVEFNLLPVCKRVVDAIEPISSSKKLKIEVAVSDTLRIVADKEMVKTILRNLITNAVKYSYPDGLISVNALIEGEKVLVEVIDRGVGISPEKVDSIFSTRFLQSTPGTANETGSGLGLILCKEFVEKHNGTIWVESLPGEETKFSFTLHMPC
jgi:signal transduction histidine kinase